MKPAKIQTPCEDNTEFENFKNVTKKLLQVSKDELNAKRTSYDQNKTRNKKHSKTIKARTK